MKKNTRTATAAQSAPVRWLGTLGRVARLDSPAAAAPAKPADFEFESLVHNYYRSLYQFAYSLTRQESEACDLTQQTYYIWAIKGHQLRDATKAKTWLFTTLHREFLRTQRRRHRHPEVELSQSEGELPAISPTMVNELDAATVVQSLAQVEEPYQAPVALFYLENYSYKEIADILDVPVGTVQSRLARGKARLQQIIVGCATAAAEEQRE